MKISKALAVFGVLMVTILSTGCIKGPIAEGGFSFFPGGISFDGANAKR